MPGVSYAWSPASAFADPARAMQTITPSRTATYKRTATLANSCVSEDEVTISVVPSGTIDVRSNDYRLAKWTPHLYHQFARLAGTTRNELWVSESPTLDAAKQRGVFPSSTTNFVDLGAASRPGTEYFVVLPDACR